MPTAVLLDRDGVVVENVPTYTRTIDDVRFLDGAIDALVRLTDFGVPYFFVSNQSAVGRGLITEDAARAVHTHIEDAIRSAGGKVTGSYLCFHSPSAACSCRKPQPGLLLSAARDWGIDLHSSVMIGDAITDIQAASAVGAASVLVMTGRGRQQFRRFGHGEAFVTPNVETAVEFVLGRRVGPS